MSKNDLIARAKRSGAPLIDRNRVTFVWRGKNAPQLVGDFNAWTAADAAFQLEPDAPGVWKRTLEFPQNAYIEYAFVNARGRLLDPFNPRTTPNGVGGTNNFFYMPGAAPTPYAQKRRGIARGRVTTHTLKVPGMVIGNTRKIRLYQPPTRESTPLLVAFDGQDYLQRAQLPTLLDNLIADKKIRPVAVAMVENTKLGGGSARMAEYALSELTLLFLLKRLVPFAQNNLELISPNKTPGAYAVMGASIGGLMAVYAALRAPHVFGVAISQAGAFELYDTRMFVFDLAALPLPNKPRVWLDVGQLDWLLQVNRRMNKHLRAHNFAVRYREHYAYHSWVAWRDVLPDALQWAFGAA